MDSEEKDMIREVIKLLKEGKQWYFIQLVEVDGDTGDYQFKERAVMSRNGCLALQHRIGRLIIEKDSELFGENLMNLIKD